MSRPTHDTERRLLAALEQITDDTPVGVDPTASIVKAAKAHQLRRGEVELAVRAYNTGRTNFQRESEDDLLAKTAEFPLADPSRVLAELYPEHAVSPAAHRKAAAVSDDYALSPTQLRSLMPVELPRQAKAAAAKPDPPRDCWTASQQLRALSDQAAAADAAVTTAELDLLGTFGKVADALFSLNAPPLGAVRESVELLYGEPGGEILDVAVELRPDITKLAQHQQPHPRTVDAVGPVFDAVAVAYAGLQQLHVKQATAAEARQAYIQGAGQYGPEFLAAPRPLSLLETTADRFKQAAEDGSGYMLPLGAGLLSPAGLGGAYSMVKAVPKALPEPADQTKGINKLLLELDDPVQDEQMRRIAAQNVLQGLTLNDPVLSGYRPEAIAQAYNSVVETSPSAATNRALLQSSMRKALEQGQMDSFEVGELLRMEQDMQKRDQPQIKGVATDGSVL